MGSSTILKLLKNVMAGALAFATISYVVPESAQAISFSNVKKPKFKIDDIQPKFSGEPNQDGKLEFYIDFSVEPDSSSNGVIFEFENAIKNATYICDENAKESLCAGESQIYFIPGNLEATEITGTPPEILEDLKEYLDDEEEFAEYMDDGVLYKGTLYDENNPNNFLNFAFFDKTGVPDQELVNLILSLKDNNLPPTPIFQPTLIFPPIPIFISNGINANLLRPTGLIIKSNLNINLEFSGTTDTGEPFVDFNLDPFVPDSSPNNSNVGIFDEAIQDVTVTCSAITLGCTEVGEELFFSSGDLTASLISEDTVQYDVKLFDDTKANFLNLAIQVTPNSEFTANELINSLESLSEFLIDYNFNALVAMGLNQPLDFEASSHLAFDVTVVPVPEPDATGNLWGAGAIGALLLLKRIGRSRKLTLQPSHKSTVKTQEVA